MPESALHHDPEALLAQAGWVRDLARRLASGADGDDVEQSTWLAALRARPRADASLRGWLTSAARNADRQRRRSAGRRGEHEARAARPEALLATDELVARAELQRHLVGAVLQLAEPYRTAILLRFFGELPPREIAARQGLPVATVHTHLARGLQRLRERLDAEHAGDRGAWLAALAPLWVTLETSRPGLGALLAMKLKITVVGAALAAAGAVAWWIAAPRAEGPTARAGADRVAALEPAEVRPRGESGDGPAPQRAPAPVETRTAVQPALAGAPVAPAAVPSEPKTARLVGRALDAEGRALPQVLLRVVPADGSQGSLVRSGADGTFVVEDAPERGRLESGGPEHVLVLGAPFSPAAREDVCAVLAPRLTFAGEVVDGSGAAVAGALVALELPEDLRARFDVVLDHAARLTWQVRCDEGGRFSLADVPQVAGARLTARADGLSAWDEAAPAFSDLALRLVLARPDEDSGFVRGVVLGSSGVPVSGALVAFGLDTQRVGEDGSFAFAVDDPSSFGARVGIEPRGLSAVAPGWLPATWEAPLEGGRPRWPAHVTLRLESPALTLHGRVLDDLGEPFPGARVYVADATLFGAVDGRPALVETLFASGEGIWRFVESDAQGRFALEGLLDRDYVVRAHDPRTLLSVDSAPVPAGARDVRLELPTDRVFARVAGRVLSLGGVPIRGASVHPMCDALRVTHMGRTLSTAHGGVQGTTTDEEGRFELFDVPMSLVYLRVDGEDILPVEYGRYVEGDPRFADSEVRELPVERITALEIRVAARCHMQVELAHAPLADELAVLDGEGRELSLSLYSAGSRSDGPRQPLHDGRSAVLSVPESGRTLVLYLDGEEVDRSAIALDPARTTSVLR